MVQEYTSPVRVYEHSFEMVMAAYEKRFPTCKLIPAFLGSDITYEYKSDDHAIHIVERRCRIDVNAPYLIRKIAGIDHAVFIQRNSLNWRDRTLKIEAWNESFDSRIVIKEKCYYSVHPENRHWTLFEQDASLDVVSFFGFEAAIEKLAIKGYTNNLKKGKEIIMHFIKELIAEGKTDFPLFDGSQGRPRIKSYNDKTKTVREDADTDDEPLSDLEDDVVKNNPDDSEATNPKNKTRKATIENDDVTSSCDTMDSHGIPVDQSKIERVVEPPPLQDYKLDDKYIRRYLGELTMQEENRLMQLRRRFQASNISNMPSESVMLRFLRARDANLDKAFEMLKNSLHWRRQHHVDTIIETWNPPDALLEYYPGGWHHFDRDGRPVYIIRLGSMDFKGLLKTVGEDGFVKQVVSVNEEGLRKCIEATDIFQKPITNWTLIVDLDGLSMRHLWRPGVRALLKIIEVVEANYPETMGRLLIVRAPKVFGVLWTLLYPFIDENSRKKFMIYTGDDYQGDGGLIDYIPNEYIPDFLGGLCKCNINAGKVVPKTFYKYNHIAEATDSTWLDTELYHTAHIIKGAPFDITLAVSEAESVITWDFDVIEGDCVFQVLRHKRAREASSNGNITSCIGDNALSKISVRPGVDAQVVERPIVCAQGDSVQGSHICQQAGVFILQWKFSNPSLRQSLKIHSRTKIMYYYEILPSRDFKGSMSSMTSSVSGFSQLSMTSSSHNTSLGASSIASTSVSGQQITSSLSSR